MEPLGLLVGHLLGDYVFQDDWQAKWKAAPAGTIDHDQGQRRNEWLAIRPVVACAIHCTLYTLCVWACNWWLPWWGLLLCWLLHFPLDRFRLARRFMSWRHEGFATGALAPWSVVVVDNTFHLLVLFVIGLLVRG